MYGNEAEVNTAVKGNRHGIELLVHLPPFEHELGFSPANKIVTLSPGDNATYSIFSFRIAL